MPTEALLLFGILKLTSLIFTSSMAISEGQCPWDQSETQAVHRTESRNWTGLAVRGAGNHESFWRATASDDMRR